MYESVGPQVISYGFWKFLLGMENHSSTIVLDAPASSIRQAIGVVRIHPSICFELWIGVILAVLDPGIFPEDAILRMVYLDDDFMRGCHPFK